MDEWVFLLGFFFPQKHSDLQQNSLWEYSTRCTIGAEVQIHQGPHVLLYLKQNADVCWRGDGSCFVLAARAIPPWSYQPLCYLLCLLAVSPAAIECLPLAHFYLVEEMSCPRVFTPTCDQHNASLNGDCSLLFLHCTCVNADSRNTLGSLLNCI